MGRVGVERVRVEAQPGDRDALAHELVHDLGRLRGGEVCDVDMARPGIAASGSAGLRPAGDLEDLESGADRPVRNLHERRGGKRGGQEAELHYDRTSGLNWVTGDVTR